MLFASDRVRVAAEYGTATLWLGYPGEPVNALDLARLRELDAALDAVERNPSVTILVVRSAKPAGFCAGVHPAALASLPTDADRAAFAAAGQRTLDRLAALPVPTVAFIDGPCLGAGLELALACTHRLCVARPTTHLGFPDFPPCFGGSARLRQRIGRRAEQLLTSGRTLSGREARTLGLVDDAFCERRGKIELRTFLDRLERTPWRAVSRGATDGFAAERRRFAAALGTAAAQATIARQLAALTVPAVPLPDVVGLVGDSDAAAQLGAAVALNGGRVLLDGDPTGVFAGIAVALARGFITPLEAEQARGRVTLTADVRCLGCVVAVADDGDAVRVLRGDPATVAAWLRPFGLSVARPTPLAAAA